MSATVTRDQRKVRLVHHRLLHRLWAGAGQAAAERGSNVVVTARNPRSLTEFAVMENAMVLKLDVTDSSQVTTAVQAAEHRFGRIDVLVNNAGIGYFAAVEEGEDSQIRRMFDINLFGVGAVTCAVLPGMRRLRQGFIVNISSIGGLCAFPAIGWYNATSSASTASEYLSNGAGLNFLSMERFPLAWNL